jgi:hypothetical protein
MPPLPLFPKISETMAFNNFYLPGIGIPVSFLDPETSITF